MTPFFPELIFTGTAMENEMTGIWGYDITDFSVTPAIAGPFTLGPFSATRVPEPVPTLSHLSLVLLLGLLVLGGGLLLTRGGLA